MQIDGDTIKFKSNYYFFHLERKGWKPNILRILDHDVAFEVDKWWLTSQKRYIEITITDQMATFKRELLWAGKIDNLIGKQIWMFCWMHPKSMFGTHPELPTFDRDKEE